MKYRFKRVLYLLRVQLFILLCGSYSVAQVPDGVKRVDLGQLDSDMLTEISGIAASRTNLDVLWVHNDSNDKNRIYSISTKGKMLGTYYLKGATAVDWEDIAIGPGPLDGHDYIYIGDIGDNDAKRNNKHIFRVLEPEVHANRQLTDTVLTDVDKIMFRYPDGRWDAEALMVDPWTKDIYIVTKTNEKVHVYIAEYPQNLKSVNQLKFICRLDMTGVTAGDISSTGCEVLIKTYDEVYYWNRVPGQKLRDIFAKKLPQKLPYIAEPQGEAISWHPSSVGYYTVSEEKDNIKAHLYFFKF